MFNVARPSKVPNSLTKKNKEYNHTDVVSILKPMFHGKCYLCERDEIQDVEIEHFEPHMKVEAIKFDWNNLFYSCSRCNSIKSSTHINLLDCTDSSVNVYDEIICEMPSAPNADVVVKASKAKPSVETSNTVKLLNLCYNSTNTALRGVSREALMEQMFEYYCIFLKARIELTMKSNGKTIKLNAKETIEAMLEEKHPFSACWRRQYLDDSFLTTEYPELRVGF